jgi:hypothetical protein
LSLITPIQAGDNLFGVNRHASDTRIGLMDSMVPIEAMISID